MTQVNFSGLNCTLKGDTLLVDESSTGDSLPNTTEAVLIRRVPWQRLDGRGAGQPALLPEMDSRRE